MPSEGGRVDEALRALAPRVEAFRSAVALAEEELRAHVARHRGVAEFRAEQALMELGPFAVHRIDPQLFARLVGGLDDGDPRETMAVLARAEGVLGRSRAGRGARSVAVPPGGDLRDVVKGALDEVGQVFGASRAVELARSRRFDPTGHADLLERLPFRRWNRTERMLAPPLVVSVEPDDLICAGLAEFLDGLVKIVLVARGTRSPAPLARLVTPGTFVVQTTEPRALEALARSPHPGVGLLLDEAGPETARFVHDPDAGTAPWSRLSVEHMPERPTVGRGRRAPSWVEELDHLESLATAPAAAEAMRPAGADRSDPQTPEAAPADRLAAWLLHQAASDG